MNLMKREVFRGNVTNGSFVKGHGVQRAGIYYNTVREPK